MDTYSGRLLIISTLSDESFLLGREKTFCFHWFSFHSFTMYYVSLSGPAAGVCASLLFLVSAVMFALCLWFVKIETSLHGFKKTLQNKFVIITLMMGVSSAMTTILQAIVNVYAVSDNSLDGQTYFWMSFFQTLAVECHVCLLYLRSFGIMQFSPGAQLWMKALIAIAVSFGFLNIVFTGILCDVQNGDVSDVLAELLIIFQYIYSIAVVLLDSSTAFVFARYIAKQKKLFGEPDKFHSTSAHQSTNIIASTGLWIASVSLSAVIVVVTTYFIPIVVTLSCVGAILWMQMKMRLEKVTNKAEKESQNPQKNMSQRKDSSHIASNAENLGTSKQATELEVQPTKYSTAEP
jgi:hypothetical protein